MSPLSIEVDKLNKSDWNQLITQFDDATLFQTNSFETLSKNNTSNIVVKSEETILGCCHVSLKQISFLNLWIANIKWGPLCMKKGQRFNPDILLYLIRGIKKEYAIKRGYLIRISPHATGEKKELLKKILEDEGFYRNDLVRPYRSFRVDLTQSVDDLRKNLRRKWRAELRKAEENEINIVEGTNIELLDIIEKLTAEGERVKGFRNKINYGRYRQAQNELPEPLKMRFMICESQGEPLCAIAYSVIGDTAVYTLAGTGEKAYKLRATYLINWRMILRAKERGLNCFDLGPFNRQINPGVYTFKRGIAGRKRWEAQFLGEYLGSFTLSGRLVRLLLQSVTRIQDLRNG